MENSKTKITSSEIREKFLNFFEQKGHKRIPSASLVPEGDSTTLFTGSGMQPMVPYLLGEKHPLGQRLVNSQKSFRAEDIEEVGDNRHTTFFEMLGNWSLGDYWKDEQISWIFEFLTKEAGIDPNKLFVSVFAGNEKYNIPKDTESPEIWKRLFTEKNIEAKEVVLTTEENASKVGMQGGRIFYYQDKNWWSRTGLPETMPVGEPGGPDSEIFYEFSEIEHDTKYGEHCHPNCDCGRYMEIGNNVFMEYKKVSENSFENLPQKNVDFGGGLERISAASNNDPVVFNTELFKPVISKIKDLSSDISEKSIRITADHLRASVFLIVDGITPSNKERGYILRRLIRRAALQIFNLPNHPKNEVWITNLIQSISETYLDVYPEIKNEIGSIITKLLDEVDKFEYSFNNGVRQFISRFSKTGKVSGKDVFVFFSSYGLPYEIAFELAKERGVEVDKTEFEEEMKKHQELSRTASAGMFKGGLADHSDKVVRLHSATHLLNAALRKVLGENVWQKGSNITEERTRFDFTHDQKMTDEQKAEVEKLVNEWVQRDLTVKKEEMPLEEAKKLGAIGVFGEKYPDKVSVYTIYDPETSEVVSREFCGGPHVGHTGAIGKFKIQKEESASAGVRRIKAVLE